MSRFLIVTLALASVSHAAELPSAARVALTTSSCAREMIDEARLGEILAIELSSTLGRPVTVTPGTDKGADYQIAIDCASERDNLDLNIQRTNPPASFHGRVSTVDVPEQVRPRTIALAISEELRWITAPASRPASVPAPRPPIAALEASASAPATPAIVQLPERETPKSRLRRNVLIGFAVSAVALAIAGAPLIQVGVDNHYGSLIGGGSAIEGLCGVALIGAGASLGVYLKERSRSKVALAPMTLSSGSGVLLAGSF